MYRNFILSILILGFDRQVLPSSSPSNRPYGDLYGDQNLFWRPLVVPASLAKGCSSFNGRGQRDSNLFQPSVPTPLNAVPKAQYSAMPCNIAGLS